MRTAHRPPPPHPSLRLFHKLLLSLFPCHLLRSFPPIHLARPLTSHSLPPLSLSPYALDLPLTSTVLQALHSRPCVDLDRAARLTLRWPRWPLTSHSLLLFSLSPYALDLALTSMALPRRPWVGLECTSFKVDLAFCVLPPYPCMPPLPCSSRPPLEVIIVTTFLECSRLCSNSVLLT